MNAPDVLKYGHLTVLGGLEGIPYDAWTQPGVCGHWSVKDIVAHLASYEQLLIEILNGFLDGGPTPTLNIMMAHGPEGFNDVEVEKRQGLTAAETVAEYTAACEKAMHLAGQLPPALFSQNGSLAWYGEAYDLDDFIAYTFYGHKREHVAQIVYFRDHVLPQSGG